MNKIPGSDQNSTQFRRPTFNPAAEILNQEIANSINSERKDTVVKALTQGILITFKKCNPRFEYSPVNNPKRCLTEPSEGVFNDGYDNANSEYLLFAGDVIRSPENEEYVIWEMLGKGTFGQVVKCVKKDTGEQVAIKVIKNKTAYTNQAKTEIKIFKQLETENPANMKYIVRMMDYFVFRNHICLVFELLQISLWDLMKINGYTGFSLKFIQRLVEQIIDSLYCLERNRIIHCDLKPENILFADDHSDLIKVIDLGSACHINKTVYTYIQSRFYRAPEVILGIKYTNKIDSWSLGCIAAEFYLGLPLFPGSSEYDQMKRILDVIGKPADEMIDTGVKKSHFFKKDKDTGSFIFKTVEEYERFIPKDLKTKIHPHKKYFILNCLESLENYYAKSKQREKNPTERERFHVFIHFLKGLLNLDPEKRWTASQARLHPFITGAPFESEWMPPSPSEALEKIHALKAAESENIAKLVPILKEATTKTNPSLNNESFRPLIDFGTEKKEESKSQTVALLNNQADSSKPGKKKLSLKAGTFNPIKTDQGGQIQESMSEPNSATLDKTAQNFKKKSQHDTEETKEEKPAMLSIPESMVETPNPNENKDGATPQGGVNHREYTPQDPTFYNKGKNHFDGGSQKRQRSNSDHENNPSMMFNAQKYKNKYHHQTYGSHKYRQNDQDSEAQGYQDDTQGGQGGYQNHNQDYGNQGQRNMGGGNYNSQYGYYGNKKKY